MVKKRIVLELGLRNENDFEKFFEMIRVKTANLELSRELKIIKFDSENLKN